MPFVSIIMPYFKKEVSSKTIEVLQNWLSKEGRGTSYCSIKIDDTKLNKRTIFVYAGNIGDAQGLEIIFREKVELLPRSWENI